MRTIRTLGWKHPHGVDGNSSNCLLNSYANTVHIDQYGFHPYALELAQLVRQGVLSRKEGLRRIALSGNLQTIRQVRKKLV
jgi:hypothetical protein